MHSFFFSFSCCLLQNVVPNRGFLHDRSCSFTAAFCYKRRAIQVGFQQLQDLMWFTYLAITGSMACIDCQFYGFLQKTLSVTGYQSHITKTLCTMRSVSSAAVQGSVGSSRTDPHLEGFY